MLTGRPLLGGGIVERLGLLGRGIQHRRLKDVMSELVALLQGLIALGGETAVRVDLFLRRTVDRKTLPGLHRGAVVGHPEMGCRDGHVGRAHREVHLFRVEQQLGQRKLVEGLCGRRRRCRCGGAFLGFGVIVAAAPHKEDARTGNAKCDRYSTHVSLISAGNPPSKSWDVSLRCCRSGPASHDGYPF